MQGSSVITEPQVDLSAIIVSYNVKEFLEQAILSIQRALKGLRGEVFVVDNASMDGSPEMVREKFPEVKLIANSENRGFAAANNQALRLARGRYLALVNPDTLLEEDTFTTIIRFMEQRPETGVVGCKILNPDGSLQLQCRRSFPTPWVALTKMTGLSTLFPKSRLFARYFLTYLDANDVHEVEAVSGSFLVLRREVIETVGLLDEDFFLYGEDLDWCYRIRQAGWKIHYLPETKIVHFKGESAKRSGFDTIAAFYQAMHHFVRKHFRRKYLFYPEWLLVTGIWFRAGLTVMARVLRLLASPLTDLSLLVLSIVLANILRFGDLRNLGSYLPLGVGTAYIAIWMACLAFMGLYDRRRLSSSQAGLAVLLGLALNATLTFFFKQYAFSRAVVLIAGILSLLLVAGWRFTLKLLPRLGLGPFKGTLGKTLLGRRTLIVGTGHLARRLVEKIQSRVDTSYDVKGFVSFDHADRGKSISGVPVLGTIDELGRVIHREKIQEVIFSMDRASYDPLLEIISKAKDYRVNFKLVPDTLDVIIGKATIDRMDDLPLVDIDYRLHRRGSRWMKRGMDVVGALLALVFLIPVFLYARWGKGLRIVRRSIDRVNGAPTFVWEFHNAKSEAQRWWMSAPYFWSVLKGDLSLVGAEMRNNANGELPPGLRIKPGLTGLVQLHRRDDLSIEEKEKYHLYYVKNYSPLLDLEILFKTIFRI